MPKCVLRARPGRINVGREDAIQIAPSNDETQRDTTLVDSLDVVSCPRDGVRDAGIWKQGQLRYYPK